MNRLLFAALLLWLIFVSSVSAADSEPPQHTALRLSGMFGDRMVFTSQTLVADWQPRDGKAPSHFTIAGADRDFAAATAVIDGNTIVVRSDSVAHPVAVRYAWGSGDTPNLSNKEGLPASSFRTDDWPIQ